ncbi:MAG: FAD-dependent oxidoreductase [Casimicrobiaceae bacterium]
MRSDHNFDLIVIGAGGAGMTAALFAAIEGLQVVVLESTEHVGGTTAYSGGTTWIPNTHLASTVDAKDNIDKARDYLTRVIGGFGKPALIDAFLANGPAAVRKLEDASEVRFRAFASHPDYQSEVEGATPFGRALEPLPFDGRRLGEAFSLVRPPIPEFTLFNGMMVDRYDIGHLLQMTRSWRSFCHSIALFGRYAADRVHHPRGTRLVMGNALVARLLQSLRQRNVAIWIRTQVKEIISGDGRAVGVRAVRDGELHELGARRGIVLAAGGFNRSAALRSELIGSVAPYSAVAPGSKGEAIELAVKLGGRTGTRNFDNALWAPVSVRKRPDGSTAVFPHFIMDRGKPGTVVVNQAGKRFLNETTSYHLFGHAMIEAHRREPCIPAYLIADRRALEAYGLGMVRPGGRGVAYSLGDGYLVEGRSLDELAQKLDIDPAALRESVEQINRAADSGIDPAFGRGTTLYQRNLGDPAVGPNPTLGRVEHAPFYAVSLYPGDIGASCGLLTDENACVLDGEDRPVPGLYAVGNDMNSMMGGTYPGPGITLGPAVAFAYLAVKHVLRRRIGTSTGTQDVSTV